MSIASTDLQFNWHPCSQMKDYEAFPPLVVKQASGSVIELENGHRLIDGISSWWCKSLGHQHPTLKQAIQSQIEKFEHVIFANTTNQIITALSEKLCSLMPNLNKVFYAGDGSCAVEIALKMSLHYRQLNEQSHKHKFLALSSGYHGETIGALSVSDLGLYRAPYQSLCFEPIFIEPCYVSGEADPLWHDCHDHWQKIEPTLNFYKENVTAIILEPIVQGAGGMHIYSQDFLSRLASFAQEHDIHIIADEIMTGIGRTGKMLACEHAKIQPDFICLSKGLTSGWMPFSAVLTTNHMYQTFYADYSSGRSFLHSHTYSGNALGACIALATLQVIEAENLCDRANQLQLSMRSNLQKISEQTGLLQNIRGIGAIVAADLINSTQVPRLGYAVFKEAIKLGALIRPLGNTLYWLPPLNIKIHELNQLADITCQAIDKVKYL